MRATKALAARAAEPTLGLPSVRGGAGHGGWPREPRASRRARTGTAERRGGAGRGGTADRTGEAVADEAGLAEAAPANPVGPLARFGMEILATVVM